MKTKTLLFNQPLQLCESTSTLSDSSRSSFWRLAHGHFTQSMHKLRQLTAPVLKGVLAGLHALAMVSNNTINTRIFVGLGLMGVVAPLSACFYMLFDRVDFVQGWYHVNYFHLFFLLGPHLFLFFCLAGCFLLFPQGGKRTYMLAVPLGYNIAKIIWLTMASSNSDFWAVVPASLILIGVLISLVLFLAFGWLAQNKFHREDAFKARINKLCELADEFDDAKFKSMAKTVYREEKAFQNQY